MYDFVRQVLIGWVIVMVLLIVGNLVSGCGTTAQVAARAQGAHEVVNTITDIADPAYGLAVEVCDARELIIVQREGTTAAQDQADIATIRVQCDRVFQGFEALRELQLAARAAIQAVVDNPDDAAYRAALAVVQQVVARWTEIQALLRDAGLVRRSP